MLRQVGLGALVLVAVAALACSGGGAAASKSAGGGAAGGPQDVTVKGTDQLRFAPANLTARANAPIRVTLDDSGDALIVGPDHPLTVAWTPDGPSPRVAVRFGLEAELARPLYYELADIALAEGHDPPGVWSDGAFFPFVP